MNAGPSSNEARGLEAGAKALARGEWEAARAIFAHLVAENVTPEALEGQSWAAWWLDDAQVVFESREHAYQLYKDAGSPESAARMAIWLGNDYIDFRGETAVSNGWIQAARRLLNDVPTAPEHGWLAVLLGEIKLLMEEDTVAARQHAQEAIAIGRQLHDVDLEVVGRTIEGLALVTEGDMSQGMGRLDEAATEAVSGGLGDLACVNLVLCHLLYACERARDYERATQWCHRVREFADHFGFRFAQGTCRAHYATVLLWRGMWAEAEKELKDAGRYLSQSRPPWGAEARVRLAELRRRQGRLDEAEQYFREVQWHPLAPLGLAELALEAGRMQDAQEYARRVLRIIPEQSIAQRAAALDVLARTLAAAGDNEGAAEALDAFADIAATVGTLPLRATRVALAGEVAAAAGEQEISRGYLEDAVTLFERCGAPYETARARRMLAEVMDGQGRKDRARREAMAALKAVEELGAEGEALKVRALLTSIDQPESSAGRGALTERQIEIIRLVGRGMGDREIAAALVMSEHTVHRHIANILQRLNEPSRAAAVAHASRLGLL